MASVTYNQPGAATIVRNGCTVQIRDVDAHLAPEAGQGACQHFPSGFATVLPGGALLDIAAKQSYVLPAATIAHLQSIGAPMVPVDVAATATTTASNVTLPSAGTLVRVTNSGSATVFVAISGTATNASAAVPAGGSVLFDVPASAATISVLASSGAQAIVVARGPGSTKS